MFCSSCGKTINPDWKKCKHCGAPVGESRFDGVPYTSAQARIAPGQSQYKDAMENKQYTRASYTGDSEARMVGAVDGRTTYRPVYEGSSVPEEMRQDLRASSGAEGDAPEDDDASDDPERSGQIDPEDLERNIEGFDLSQIKSRPIVAKRPQGLSSDVKEYVKRLENGEERPTTRRGKHLSPSDPYVAEEPSQAAPPEEEYVSDEPQGIDRGKIIKIVAALVAVAALFVIGIYIAPKIIKNFKQEATVPIEGVTLKLYDDGLALIGSHTQDQYKKDVLAVYQSGDFTAFTTKLDADQSEINALLPATPGVNDQLFLQALSAIQTDIANALTYDAVEIASNGTGTANSPESTARWTTINDAVTGLAQITSATGLTAIVNGERIANYEAPTVAPQATPTPSYPSLSKGDKGDSVQKMQERLWQLGYLSDDRDGKFGSNTQTALKLFQQAAGLEATGIADSKTQEALYSDAAPRTENAQATPTPAPTAEPSAEPTIEPVSTTAI